MEDLSHTLVFLVYEQSYCLIFYLTFGCFIFSIYLYEVISIFSKDNMNRNVVRLVSSLVPCLSCRLSSRLVSPIYIDPES